MPASAAAQMLAQSRLFARLPHGEREALAALAEVRSFRAGERLIERGRRAEALFAVRSGYVKVYLPGATARDEHVIDIHGPGTLIGETAATGVGDYQVSAVALDAVEALAIPAEALNAALARNYDVVLTVMGAVTGSLRGLLNQVTELKMKSTAQRLAMFLVQLSPVQEGPAEIDLPYSKRVVAEKLGMTPETLSRSIAKLAPVGVTPAGRDRLVVADMDALAEFAGFIPDEDDDAEMRHG
ncbi:Crp/Fnr family transcriptional regulator [Caenispirillum bisanense]|uniref:Crp/Fnr family transcriptional regulator n=1 Tax=Caenispirillum bisanense TaxID=414052 RepID=UPI0031D48029